MALKIYRRNGGIHWWMRGTVAGTMVHKSTKLVDRDLADKLRQRVERLMEEAHALGPAATKTFDDAAEVYVENGGSERFLAPLRKKFGKSRLRDIKQNDLDKAARELYPIAQPETRNRQCYTPFIAVWNEAAVNDWIPAKKWRRPKKLKGTNVVRLSKKRAGTFPVDYEHAARFVAAMSPGPAMVMTTLFYSGMRPIELFALEARAVNLDGRWVTLTSTKTGEPRGVPIHEFLVPLFASLLHRGGAVFRTPRGEPYEAIASDEDGKGGGGLKSAINGARRRSDISDIAPYSGRHSCSTALVVAGVHPHIKDQILGHAADSMSRHYTNVPQAPLIEAINKLPVPDLWRALPWWNDPLAWSGKLAQGTGRRTDLGF